MADQHTPDFKVNAPQKGALVGDEAVREAATKVEPDVVDEAVTAQVAAERAPDADEVQVFETTVATDTVVTDPSSPEAVQIPDAGKGSLDLPVHRLTAPTPEDVFADEASSADDPEDTDDATSDEQQGRSPVDPANVR